MNVNPVLGAAARSFLLGALPAPVIAGGAVAVAAVAAAFFLYEPVKNTCLSLLDRVVKILRPESQTRINPETKEQLTQQLDSLPLDRSIYLDLSEANFNGDTFTDTLNKKKNSDFEKVEQFYTNLHGLKLKPTKGISNWLPCLKEMTSLKKLSFAGVSIENEFDQFVNISFPNLEELDLTCCRLQHEQVVGLVSNLSNFPQLKVLKLTGNTRLSPSTYEAILSIQNTKLEKVHLSSTCEISANKPDFKVIFEQVKIKRATYGRVDSSTLLQRVYNYFSSFWKS